MVKKLTEHKEVVEKPVDKPIDKVGGLSIRTFGTREVREMGLSSFLRYSELNGLAIITTHNKPRGMYMPFTLLGMKRAFSQVMEINNLVEENELTLSVRLWLENAVKVIDGLDE